MQNSRAMPHSIDEASAEKQDNALAIVHDLLRRRGIQARRQQRISLGLFASREEISDVDRFVFRQSWLEYFPPELVVTGPQGWREATVTIGERSGAYLLSLRNGPGLQKVRSAEPEKVAGLIAGALGAAR